MIDYTKQKRLIQLRSDLRWIIRTYALTETELATIIDAIVTVTQQLEQE